MTDLVVTGWQCAGATFVTTGEARGVVSAGRTLLATGGVGQVFRETTNPAIATGDGIAMAARAGALVVDLEFVQFHPTVLSVGGAPRFLLSEALRGEGARLINKAGEAFVERYEPVGDLASRDLVSRAIVREAERTGSPVYLSLAHLDPVFVKQRFPTSAQACAQAGLDLAGDPIPVSPAAHYVMGGVDTDLDGATSLPGLFAAGEVACTGAHGANRLASNSLLEGLVFGARAAAGMKGALRPARMPDSAVMAGTVIAGTPIGNTVTADTVLADAVIADTVIADTLMADTVMADTGLGTGGGTIPSADQVRDLMWRCVGVLRARPSLERAVVQLQGWAAAVAAGRPSRGEQQELRRIRSMVTAGLLMARAAWRRTESRGAHFREDFPSRDDLHWNTRVTDRLHVD